MSKNIFNRVKKEGLRIKHSYEKKDDPLVSCSICLQNDLIDKEIYFDENGVCRYCLETKPQYESLKGKQEQLEDIIQEIKEDGVGRDYDCIIGMSGGVDSSYIAHLCKVYELRPLVVHFDNGWNSELSIDNIYKIINKNQFDLETFVINWEEFKDLQRSFIKASVIDIEMVTDHAINATLARLTKEHKIKYYLPGGNIATESGMPTSWSWRKNDWINIKNIHKKFGKVKLKTFPTYSSFDLLLDKLLGAFSPKRIYILDHVDYKKNKAVDELKDIYGWREYGGKHYESIFTKFYQGYILPQKFNVDKRITHLSSLIRNDEMTLEEARGELNQELYSEDELTRDIEYFCNKLEFTREEFDQIMKERPVDHAYYKSDQKYYDLVSKLLYFLKSIGLRN